MTQCEFGDIVAFLNLREDLMNSSILLTTANARYSHSSLGLRCIFANLDESLRAQTQIIEKTISDSAQSIAQSWIDHSPKIVGVGIYIWNIELIQEAIKIFKINCPTSVVIIGGPEVSYGVSSTLMNMVDFIVELEGEILFNSLCKNILEGHYPTQKINKAHITNTLELNSPYKYYSDEDIKNRKIYVEASRGCAFKCHFCLSSLDEGIRNFQIDDFLEEIKKLYDRGARQFKFVDRTFNLDIKQSIKILDFFLTSFEKQDFFLHFEVIPDRLPSELKKYIEKFKAGILQFEVGIQSLDKDVSNRIGRRQNKEKALENLSYLRYQTHAHLHVDLIIGLPGATLEIFRDDLNTLVAVGLQEVQIGILKNLKGTPLAQHILPFEMKFTHAPPYEIISNNNIDKNLMVKLRAFHKFWDKYYNSGNFVGSLKFLFNMSNPFDEFYQLSNFAHSVCGKTFGISLDKLGELLFQFLMDKKGVSYEVARDYLLRDLLKKKGRKVPSFLKNDELGLPNLKTPLEESFKHLKRQASH